MHAVKELGLRAVLATNPIFPAVATRSRIRWAGLEPEDFELCTTYENSRITGVDMRKEDLDADALITYPLRRGQDILMENRS